jgi:probable HAF family extracellular repeat protein
MKSRRLTVATAIVLFASAVFPARLASQDQLPQNAKLPRYIVTDLGPSQSFADGINNKGAVAGTAILRDGVTQRAFLWRDGRKTGLGTLGGPNSAAFSRPNEKGQIAGNAETATPDPLGEDFCAYGTHLICLAFTWQKGVMTPLPTLGGDNSWANGGLNNRGQVAGLAENTTPDPTCPPPNVLQSKPVIWEEGKIRELPTVSGDPDGTAFAINDNGEAVGASSNCTTPLHAVRWRKDGSVQDLGNFGGTMLNLAQGINNRGEVVGVSDLAGDTAFHAFLWSEAEGMRDLGTFVGLPSSWAFGINDARQVVGMSCDVNGDCGAFLWQHGVMTDLNTLLPNNSPWNLIVGTSINSRGEIVGVGDEGKGTHAVLVTPCVGEHAQDKGCDQQDSAGTLGPAGERPRITLPGYDRRLLWQRLGLRYQIPALLGAGATQGAEAGQAEACPAAELTEAPESKARGQECLLHTSRQALASPVTSGAATSSYEAST